MNFYSIYKLDTEKHVTYDLVSQFQNKPTAPYSNCGQFAFKTVVATLDL